MTLLERFLSYVALDTQSDRTSESEPSTAKQLLLAQRLVEDMKDIGIADAHIGAGGCVYGTVPANCDQNFPVVGLIAHMDTAPNCSGKNVKPRVVENYGGGDIVLNEEKNIVMRVSDFPHLMDYVGDSLVVTDGTTLLGADDKAGVAEMIEMASRLLRSDVPHGTVKLAFTPDEEIGRGTVNFDVEKFGADYAYTMDGARLGELSYENFNAAWMDV